MDVKVNYVRVIPDTGEDSTSRSIERVLNTALVEDSLILDKIIKTDDHFVLYLKEKEL